MTDGNYKHPTGTLSTTFLKPTGRANMYIQFGYTQQKFSTISKDKYKYLWFLIQYITMYDNKVSHKQLQYWRLYPETLNYYW